MSRCNKILSVVVRIGLASAGHCAASGCLSFLRLRSSPLHQPFRACHQNPHHRARPFHLGRAPPMRRSGCPDTLQPLGRPWASRQSAMHSTSPSEHRRCLAGRTRPGPSATPRSCVSQGQGYSPIRHAPPGVFPATSESFLPLLHLRYCGLDIADDRLPPFIDDHALDPDDLRTFASLPIQRVQVRGVLPQLARSRMRRCGPWSISLKRPPADNPACCCSRMSIGQTRRRWRCWIC
jgi:hypothetical protein